MGCKIGSKKKKGTLLPSVSRTSPWLQKKHVSNSCVLYRMYYKMPVDFHFKNILLLLYVPEQGQPYGKGALQSIRTMV